MAAAVGAFAGPASADTMNILSSEPSDAAIISPLDSFNSIQFSVATDVPGMSGLWVEISSQNVPGQDGTLANDFVVGSGYLYESDAYPGTYRGNVLLTRPMPVGNYYWQASGTALAFSAPYFREYQSPVRALNVASTQPPAPPPLPPPPAPSAAPDAPSTTPLTLTLSEAQATVRRVIRRKTRRSPRRLEHNCHRDAMTSFTCKPAWFDGVFIYADTMELTENDTSYSYRFDGLRARASCVRTRSVDRCARRVRW